MYICMYCWGKVFFSGGNFFGGKGGNLMGRCQAPKWTCFHVGHVHLKRTITVDWSLDVMLPRKVDSE